MPKRNIYLPTALHDRAVEAGLDISAICRQAILTALEAEHSQTLSLVERVRILAHHLELVAQETDTRVATAFEKLRADGIDPSEYFTPGWAGRYDTQ